MIFMSKKKKESFFGERLVELRKVHQMTQDDLAVAMGVSRSLINYYENRAKNPTVEALEKAAVAFNISPKELLPQENKQSSFPKVGAPTRIDRVMNKIKSLSTYKQKVILDMIEGALK